MTNVLKTATNGYFEEGGRNCCNYALLWREIKDEFYVVFFGNFCFLLMIIRGSKNIIRIWGIGLDVACMVCN
ncbi:MULTISPECIES: hypothetical protein [Aquimarina]|uniref:Transmembrane protein n=1 Tax=Aquimarina algiphila TaxID=2047982 RepID=A0A554VQN0_9FLAO|nr:MULTISPECIES: hypothetical protein [Aquimarina]TSE10788.1 hypothetical protein FOF46_02805 [Aquimarina algiphila]